MANNNSGTGKYVIGGLIGAFVTFVIGYFSLKRINVRYCPPEGMKDITFRVSTSIDPTVFGPSYWKSFHELAEDVPCGACRYFAEKSMIFVHDLVNLKVGKNLYDPANFDKFVQLIMDIKANGNKWPKTLTPKETTLVAPADSNSTH